ncbi:SGNH/GDSL hydrolase family protein [Butyrivibrio sp. X503]|uniref:SGNH/GDSL hydrolase family protein n=1 Tax=Butyrivibrio sp. X503 TaxID=2364878 RepID=UPI000EA8CF3A|nr:SGNH/GDSL hydrolase family protein [Butyrivibrio sp. X503]RKM54235.1 SGNH/GDSL hydrolase family protein [Butyrivibrio sp. X503]
MVLSNEELKEIYFGAYEFEGTEDGYLQAFQYNKDQIEYFKGALDFWYERCTATTAKTFEFTTEASEVSFDYKIIWKGSEDSFELMIDGQITNIVYVKDIADEGRLSWKLPTGKKSVVIYLPADETVLVRNFEIDAAYTKAAKNEKVLWLGDSITQGYGPLRSGCTYVSVANRILNYDIVNQGIGGYIYDKNCLMKMEGYNPDKIIVALGTNQYGDADAVQAVEEYYERLIGIYGNEIPILCISPLWRGDSEEGIPVLMAFCEKVKEIAGSYKNVSVIDGMEMVPHLPEYFLDLLHPNPLGCEIYGRNLVEKIRKLGW